MTNVEFKRMGDKLVISVDISAPKLKAAEPSKSGKTNLVASTHGFTSFAGVRVSLNIITR